MAESSVLLSVQSLLNHQLGNFAPIVTDFNIQSKMLISTQAVASKTIRAHVQILRDFKSKLGSRRGSFRNLQRETLREELRRIVVHVHELSVYSIFDEQSTVRCVYLEILLTRISHHAQLAIRNLHRTQSQILNDISNKGKNPFCLTCEELKGYADFSEGRGN
uniref:Uncharacterized protein n=1 Tax=Erpetoichthys calabaricus TaxID=27687 RepID=A0A8C4X9Z7_ERPCA